MDNIFVIRLVNGQEIVGQIQNSGQGIKIKKPAALIIHPGQNGKPSMGLADYMMFASKKETTISTQHILFCYEPVIEIKNAYNSSFGSGIVVASQPVSHSASHSASQSNVIPFTK